MSSPATTNWVRLFLELTRREMSNWQECAFDELVRRFVDRLRNYRSCEIRYFPDPFLIEDSRMKCQPQ